MAVSARRLGLWTVAAALAAAGLVYAFRPQPVPVDLAEVVTGPLEVTIDAEGRTRVRDTYQVFAPITGFALRSPVEIGDSVTENETVVAVIQPAEPAFLDARARQQAEAAVIEAEAALRTAEVNILRAMSDLDYARSQYERTRALAERGTVAQRVLDDAILLLRTREAAVDAAVSERAMQEATLARMRAQLIGPTPESRAGAGEACCVEITAPTTGVVLDVTNVSARLVQAGAPLLAIGRTEDLELEVELLSADAVRIPPDALAYVERWGGGETLEAQVRRIEPSAFTKVSALGIEEQRVRVQLDFLAPAATRPRLGNAYRVFLRIVEWRGEDVVQVPVSALFRIGDAWSVFRVVDGRAERVTIEIGRRNQAAAEVTAGLSPGEVVVTHPSDRVAEGVRVVERSRL